MNLQQALKGLGSSGKAPKQAKVVDLGKKAKKSKG
jgi:hypothetical protein